MPHGRVPDPILEQMEQDPDGVDHASGDEEPENNWVEIAEQVVGADDNDPTHCHVEGDKKDGKPELQDELQGDPDPRKSPDKG